MQFKIKATHKIFGHTQTFTAKGENEKAWRQYFIKSMPLFKILEIKSTPKV